MTREELEKLLNAQQPTGQSISGTEGSELTSSHKAEVVTPQSNSSNMSSNFAAGAGLVSAASGGSSDSSPLSGALQGGSAGAMTGNPYAAAGGAVIGTIGAIAANKAKRKALARQIEGEKYRAISQLQQQHGQAESAGLQNMIAGLRSAFLG